MPMGRHCGRVRDPDGGLAVLVLDVVEQACGGGRQAEGFEGGVFCVEGVEGMVVCLGAVGYREEGAGG